MISKEFKASSISSEKLKEKCELNEDQNIKCQYKKCQMAYFNLSQIIFLSQVLSIQTEQVVTVLNHHLHLYMAILQFVTKQENCSRFK